MWYVHEVGKEKPGMKLPSLVVYMWGGVAQASWFVCLNAVLSSSPARATVLCSWARLFTLTEHSLCPCVL